MGFYNISLNNTDEKILKMNSSLSKLLKVNHLRYTNIRFGFRIAEIRIEIDDTLNNNEIELPNFIVEKLKIPLDCQYSILLKDNELIFGPFIGIFLGARESVVLKKLRFLNSYVLKYNEINGVIFAFTLENLNKADLLVDGYFYNPKQDIWEKATLPYPASIYKRSPFSLELREYFGTFYGNKIFNYNTFDKWNMYNRLEQFPEALELLPRTVLYQDSHNMLEFINTYNDVYIKPIDGKKGLGIFNLVKEADTFYVRTREKEGNIEWEFKTEVELADFMNMKLAESEYIMQNTIDININQKVLDIRVGMDKDQHGEWNNIMFVSRVSGENSIVSNRAVSGGEIQRVSDVLRSIYGYSEDKVQYYEDELVRNAKLVAELLERTGLNLGKLAFDFVIDKDGKIWIIEINSRYPDDSLANKIGEKDVYFDIHHTNIMYTKHLAGFGEQGNDILFNFSFPNDNTKKRYKLTIAIPVKEKNNLIEKIKQQFQKRGLPEEVTYNTTIKKVEVELEGTRQQLYHFIDDIKVGTEHRKKSIISVQEL
ncbi:YheC/YheD family protein [Paucisalibacillus sp. EB02]|uniref:YheC/YheD family endospore coat-associated protein n=1 Tax=Paucisalibacillus sp. EB02 TaxID=1347087 RepID=UPI0004B943B5|nr:YheC/YheD family protein [Paucisalibacillus sp. EB02]